MGAIASHRLVPSSVGTTYDLNRFKEAQRRELGGQATALAELRSGGKRTHWIWYIFPQLSVLGRSEMSRFYGLSGLDEAIRYLADDELETNLYEACGAVLDCPTSDPVAVMGSMTDATKLRSSMTLFELASRRDDLVFSQILDRFFGGCRDSETLEAVGEETIAF